MICNTWILIEKSLYMSVSLNSVFKGVTRQMTMMGGWRTGRGSHQAKWKRLMTQVIIWLPMILMNAIYDRLCRPILLSALLIIYGSHTITMKIVFFSFFLKVFMYSSHETIN